MSSLGPSIFLQRGLLGPECCWALIVERHSIGKAQPFSDWRAWGRQPVGGVDSSTNANKLGLSRKQLLSTGGLRVFGVLFPLLGAGSSQSCERF